MKVGFLQFNPEFGDKEKNFNKVQQLLNDVSADLIVLPELFNTGYTFLNKEELAKLAEPVKGKTYEFILSLAQRMNCLLAYGFAEEENDLFYNSMALVAPAGIIGSYRKSHLFFEERFLFNPGNTPYQVYEYKDVKLGMLICFDYIYPEAMRTLALKGAQIVLLCANLVLSFCPDAMVTRSLENRIFTITCDRTGSEKRGGKEYYFIGKSQIVAPSSEILVRVGDEECVQVVEIAPILALDKKATPHNDLFKDRREDLYFR